jgi:hypothetical protein
MWLRISRHFHFAYCPYIGISYRQHQNNTLKKIAKSDYMIDYNNFVSLESFIQPEMLTKKEAMVPKKILSHSAIRLSLFQHENRKNFLVRAFQSTGSAKVLIALGLLRRHS